MLMVIGRAAKNAILIVEFAKVAYEGGMSLVDAALEGVRVRRRALFMTSFAFILGCVPLWTAAGTGGGPQRHAAQDERERGHEEGPPTHTDAFERGVDERHTSLVRDLGELDDEDRVLRRAADHHEHSDLLD